MTQLENALQYLDQYHDEMLFLWETLVKMESPSADPAAIDLLASHLDTYCDALGMETEKFQPQNAGGRRHMPGRLDRSPGAASGAAAGSYGYRPPGGQLPRRALAGRGRQCVRPRRP